MIGRDSLAAQAGRALADDRAPLRATATRRQDVGAFVAATHYVSRDAEHAWACFQASGDLFAFPTPRDRSRPDSRRRPQASGSVEAGTHVRRRWSRRTAWRTSLRQRLR